MALLLRPEATEDLDAAARWYEGQEKELHHRAGGSSLRPRSETLAAALLNLNASGPVRFG
jgi:hypothetical protein